MGLLKGKKAIVTGGTAGIGREIALSFARQGADVWVVGTNATKANEVLGALQKEAAHPEQRFYKALADVSSEEGVKKVVEEVLQQWGNVDILVNNAGITRDQLLMKLSSADWDAVLDTNLKSVYLFCHFLIRSMMKARSGKIINISSVVGLTGNAGQVNYAASKAGMIGFSKALAQEVASRGIQVNCIAPGFIQTSMTDVLSDAVKGELLKKIPQGRLGLPQEIAHAAVFLASEWSDYITGQVLTVDGGMVM